MREYIESRMAILREEIEELNEIYGENWEDFNPMDASGGNFDNAYSLGHEHGELYSELNTLAKLLKMLNEQEGR